MHQAGTQITRTPKQEDDVTWMGFGLQTGNCSPARLKKRRENTHKKKVTKVTKFVKLCLFSAFVLRVAHLQQAGHTNSTPTKT